MKKAVRKNRNNKFFIIGGIALVLIAGFFLANEILRLHLFASINILKNSQTGIAKASVLPPKTDNILSAYKKIEAQSNPKVPILMYHKIRDIDPYDSERTQQFINTPLELSKHLERIKKAGYTAIFAKELGDFYEKKLTLPEKPIILTFDDGSYDFYINAFPLLKKYDMKATVYMIADYTDKAGYLTEKQIKDLAKSDLIEIASHTLSHPHLTKYGTDSAEYEILESKRKLEKLTGKTVWSFSYPYGLYNDFIIELVKRSGYTMAVTVTPGNKQPIAKRYELYRFPPTDAFLKKYAGI